ncbi:MAG: FixH family protein [Caulobacter sp.]
MTIAATSTTAPKGRITGWHVLVAMVAFFGLIIAVDALFIVKAYNSFSGQVASNPYEAGLAFNRTLAERRQQEVLGWAATVDTPKPGVVVVRMTDQTGQPITTLSMIGTLDRPATEVGRQSLNFKSVGDGQYEAAARLDGAWDLKAVARNGKDKFQIEARLVAP